MSYTLYMHIASKKSSNAKRLGICTSRPKSPPTPKGSPKGSHQKASAKRLARNHVHDWEAAGSSWEGA